MPQPAPSIFSYTDFRLFLDDQYRARKGSDRKFSHRFIADKVRAGSSGWFADIVKGRMNLAGPQLLALAKVFGLRSNEIDYFEALVGFAPYQTVGGGWGTGCALPSTRASCPPGRQA